MQLIVPKKQLTNALRRSAKRSDRYVVLSLEAFRIAAIQPLSRYTRPNKPIRGPVEKPFT